MSDNEKETPIEVPEDKAAFNEVLKKFRIGIKGDFYETITDDIATTGGELVFENPELLMKKLSDWHTHIDAPTRRKVIEYWFAKKGTPVPEEVVKVAGMTESQRREEEEREAAEEKRAAAENKKYIVDSENGAITVAKKDERPALDWDEAVKLSTRIKAERGEGDGKEPPFLQDGEGNWILNPKAKMTGMDLLAYDALTRSQAKGETRTPLEILKDQAKDIETMRSVFGGGGGGRGPFDSIEDLIKLKGLLGADEDTKALLSGIYKRLSEGGEGKGESEDIKALRDELKDLNKKLEEKEREKLTGQITGLQNEMSNVRGELTKARTEAGAKNEYGIMSDAIKVVDRRLGAMENALQGIFGRRPALLGAGEKRELTEAIGKEAVEEAKLDELAEKVFYPPS